MSTLTRPRIGITMRIELESDRFYLSRHYSEAVEAAGGAPVHIPLIPNQDFIRNVVENLDGILLPGSDSDVDPLRYDHDPHPKLGHVHPIKDETDLLVLREAEERAMPLFAICFGMQVLNVSRGGTLIQDIASQWPDAIKHEQGTPRDRHSHKVRVVEDSLMGRLAGSDHAPVNSHHHQAMEKVGRELVATAWSPDGLVEAVEDPRGDRFVVGVQWHPELGWERDDFARALFETFVSEARRFAERESREPIADAAVQ
ncbi:MAG TPA: gamma-glutamyl-gamma-aminobutyrate hydrolase family protein [Pyrinomonadaceae bacterium]|nr:gamma-glutamyl-gamma-aminobutyrate hydrolase family protein [Pyrinomonadaceae bacterium]